MNEPVPDYPTRDTSLIGAAGVHYVVSELSLRGLIALPTTRNTAGVDVIVTNKAGTWHANIQVKSSRSRVGFWPIGTKYSDWVAPNNFYAFIRFNPQANSLEAFLVSSDEVARLVTQSRIREKEKGLKAWAPCFYPGEGGIERLKVQWDEFGKEYAAQKIQDIK